MADLRETMNFYCIYSTCKYAKRSMWACESDLTAAIITHDKKQMYKPEDHILKWNQIWLEKIFLCPHGSERPNQWREIFESLQPEKVTVTQVILHESYVNKVKHNIATA